MTLPKSQFIPGDAIDMITDRTPLTALAFVTIKGFVFLDASGVEYID